MPVFFLPGPHMARRQKKGGGGMRPLRRIIHFRLPEKAVFWLVLAAVVLVTLFAHVYVFKSRNFRV